MIKDGEISYRGIDISDFTITNANPSVWTTAFNEQDGIYYYPNLVPVGDSVAVFDQAEFNVKISENDPTLPSGNDTYMSSQYAPVLTIIAESVQANGVAEAWGVKLNADGTISLNSTTSE